VTIQNIWVVEEGILHKPALTIPLVRTLIRMNKWTKGQGADSGKANDPEQPPSEVDSSGNPQQGTESKKSKEPAGIASIWSIKHFVEHQRIPAKSLGSRVSAKHKA